MSGKESSLSVANGNKGHLTEKEVVLPQTDMSGRILSFEKRNRERGYLIGHIVFV